jgi:hypothetical protein
VNSGSCGAAAGAAGGTVATDASARDERSSLDSPDTTLLSFEKIPTPHPNTVFARRTAAASAWMSSSVLYIANDARAVAGIPNRSITGCAQ